MTTSLDSSTGCGSSACQCAATAAQAHVPAASINGIALYEAHEARPEPDALRELAYTELLRQQAVVAGLLPRHTGLTTPMLTDSDRQVLEDMVDAAVRTEQPTAEECQRYFDAHKEQYVVGQALHVRHILFAVTPGVNVHALTVQAEKVLLSLLGKNVEPNQFEKAATEFSNCPTSTQGGDLGWIGPDDCAPELANELFHQKHAGWGMGVHPRLIHTRFGFHIIEVLGRRKGNQLTFVGVKERVTMQLTMQSRAKALHQYMQLLAGQALLEGVELDTADSPLVQ